VFLIYIRWCDGGGSRDKRRVNSVETRYEEVCEWGG
jgi:hypothetical protein